MLPLFLCAFYAIPLCRKCRVRSAEGVESIEPRHATEEPIARTRPGTREMIAIRLEPAPRLGLGDFGAR
jgi:hypothetical protein